MIELRYNLSPWHVWRVSHYFKFAVCCTPRCGSQSVLKWFGQLHPPNDANILQDMEWLTEAQRAKVMHEYATLVLVRDPWSRLVSVYARKVVEHQNLINAQGIIRLVQGLRGERYDPIAGITFRDFVIATRVCQDDHWRPISDFVPCRPFRICTPPELPAAIAELTKRCQLPEVELPTINQTNWGTWVDGAADLLAPALRAMPQFPRWDSFYDAALREEIAERYALDIARFDLTWAKAIGT